MRKYFPALIVVAMVAIAAFAVDYENWGNASIDTSGNAIFGGTVTATGRVTAAGFTSTAVQTNTTIVATGAITAGGLVTGAGLKSTTGVTGTTFAAASADVQGAVIVGGALSSTGTVTALGAVNGVTVNGSTSVSSPWLSILTNATVASGYFTTIHNGGPLTGLVFIAGGFTNVIDADITR